jgi:hypothetical protein
MAELFQDATVAWTAAVDDTNAVKRTVFASQTLHSNTNHGSNAPVMIKLWNG